MGNALTNYPLNDKQCIYKLFTKWQVIKNVQNEWVNIAQIYYLLMGNNAYNKYVLNEWVR